MPFEVVPGISDRGRGAGAGRRFPVTHRGVAPAFLVVSGHDEDTLRRGARGAAAARLTIVVLMGAAAARAARRAADRARLAPRHARGHRRRARRAPRPHVWRGTLDELADVDASRDDRRAAPATIVIGDVTRSVGLQIGGFATGDAAAVRSPLIPEPSST